MKMMRCVLCALIMLAVWMNAIGLLSFQRLQAQEVKKQEIPEQIEAIAKSLDAFVEAYHADDGRKQQQSLSAAREALESTKAEFGTHGRWLCAQARYYWYTGQNALAKAEFEKAVKSSVRDPYIRWYYGAFLKMNKDFEEMFAQYKAMYELSGTLEDLDYYVNQLDAHGKHDQAWAYLSAELDKSPDDLDKLSFQASFAYQQGRIQESIKISKSLLEKQPESVMAHISLAKAYYYGDQTQEAKKIYEKAYDLDAKHPLALRGLHMVALRENDHDKAEKMRKELYALHESGAYPNERFQKEIITLDGYRVYVFEHFKLKGKWAKKLVFYVLKTEKNTGKMIYNLSVGSYPLTDAIAREQGEVQDDERQWHADFYEGRHHRTISMFVMKKNEELDYPLIRKNFLAYIKEENKRRQARNQEEE